MVTFVFGNGPGQVGTNFISNINVEVHDEGGALFTSYFKISLLTWQYLAPNSLPFGAGGDSLSDELITGGGNDLVFWDWETVSDSTHGSPIAARYFLPATSQNHAIDIFTFGDGNDVLNLTYDGTTQTNGGAQSYDWRATAFGGTGNDLLISGGGDDSLRGDEGADIIFGGGGDDFIELRGAVTETNIEVAYGGDGLDRIYGDNGDDSLFGGADNDTIEGYGGQDYIDGGLQDDALFGGDANDALVGGADNDTLYGGDGLDGLQGGAGNRDRLFGGNGNDQLSDSDGVVLMSGGAGDDIMSSNFTSTWSVPQDTATILGGGGSDSFTMGSTKDTLNLVIAMDDGSADTADLVSLVNVANRYATVSATMGGGNDTFFGSTASVSLLQDYVFGDAGNDTIYGGAGSDTLTGGAGFLDFLIGGSAGALAVDAGDLLVDTDGVVYARGGEGNDTLNISFAANWIGAGGNASDFVTLDGNGGSDIFNLASLNAAQRLIINGDDGTLDGNETVDWTVGVNSYAGVTATMGGGNDAYIGAETGGGTLLETVYGGIGNDTLFGGAANDTLFGGDGTDTLFGGAATDTLYGGIGTDTLYGGAGFIDQLYGDDPGAATNDGADLIFDTDGVRYARGGQGDDTFDISFAANWTGAGGNAFDLVTLDGGGDADRFVLASSNAAMRILINGDDGSADDGDMVDWSVQISSYDTVTALLGAGNDSYIGTGPGGTGNLIDIVYGGVGTDTLSGGIGNDTLFGSNSGNSLVDGGDTLFGRGGDDTLAGGYGADTLDGGAGNDVLIFNPDNTVTGDNAAQDYVQGWDGATSTTQHSYDGSTINWSFDIFNGSGDLQDSLLGTAGDDVLIANTDDLYINGAAQTSGPGRLVGIEIVLLGAGADIFMANDPNGASASGIVFNTGLTVYGGDGQDVVYTGSGADRLVGDISAGSPDMLYGGLGGDIIWGDLEGQADSGTGGRDQLFGGGGDDTIFGGAAADSLYGGLGADTLNAGAGQDFVFDNDNAALFFGGDGSDYFLLGYRDASQSAAPSRTGADAIGDGNDSVYIWVEDGQLRYNTISVSLGAGNDVYTTADAVEGNAIDHVAGESGNDMISTWNGNDIIESGDGSDGAWGGSGTDTIYGGIGNDFLYGGAGNNDQIYGGTGIDSYYFARGDGAGDQIYDEFRGTPGTSQQALNALLVFPGYDSAGNPIPGASVFEVDHNLMDNAGGNDMVQLVDIDGAGGTMWRLDIVSGVGQGSSVTFDQRDIQYVILDNQAGATYEQYVWDPNAQGGGAYVYLMG